MKFYQARVTFTVDDPSGKPKKQKVNYLVDSESVTEAEARVTQFLIDRGESEFEVTAVMSSNISDIITNLQ